MERYTKPPLSYADQVTLLRERGLTVESTARAVQFLQRVNYYRFSAYTIPFQNPGDAFVPGSTLEQIERLYDLDEELRRAILSLLSPIEIFLRTRIAYELSRGWGAFAHYDPGMFHRNFNHAAWVASLDEEVNRAKETFVEHYKSKYHGFPRLPIWIACEVMSLGALSLLYTGLQTEPQRRICSLFEVDKDVFR
ncbi:MAG: Abi family protein, partial [Chloroflexi bacterium]|nr:Abi family protein [Chloroflexota bacterium]